MTPVGEKKMLNVEKRSVLLTMLLGDGCLYRSSPSQRNKTGYITVKHGWKQKDYLQWKAQLVSEAIERPVNIRSTSSYVKAYDKRYEQWCFLCSLVRMRAWRRLLYPNNKKSIQRILHFIKDIKLAACIWLCDDGTVQTAPIDRKHRQNGKVGSGMILYMGNQTQSDADAAQLWFQTHFNVWPRIKWQKYKYKGEIKEYVQLNFTVQDALVIWANIRRHLIPIESMWNKFICLEERFNRADLLQPQMRDVGTHLVKI